MRYGSYDLDARRRLIPGSQISLLAGLVFIWLVTVSDAYGADHPEYGRTIDDLEERANVLEMLTLYMRANFGLIQTWTGSFEVVEQSLVARPRPTPPADNAQSEGWLAATDTPSWGPEDMQVASVPTNGQHWRITKETCRFAIDMPHATSQVAIISDGATAYLGDQSDKLVWRRVIGRHNHRITNSDECVEFDTHELLGNIPNYPSIAGLPAAGGRVAFCRAPSKSRVKLMAFDPRDLFCAGSYTPGADRFYWDRCKSRIKFLRQGKAGNSQLFATSDSPPTYTERSVSKDGREMITQFNGKVGFNATRYSESIDGRLQIQRLITFRLVSDIWIPQSAQLTIATESEANPRIDRFLKLKEISLNQPVPDSEFALGQLGFEYGDRMVDEQKSRLLIHDGKDFVAAEGFTVDPKRMKQVEVVLSGAARLSNERQKAIVPRKGYKALLIVNVIAMLSVAGVMIYRRWGNRSH